MSMSELLNEIREKAEVRAKVLQNDIQEARDLIASYEAELAPLMSILKATSPKLTAPTGTTEAVAAVLDAAMSGTERPKVYSKSTEPPRHPHTGEVLTGSSEAMLKTVAERASTKAVAEQAKRLPRRWSQYKLPPRVRLFLTKFGNVKGQILHEQVTDWYRTVNPSIGKASLKQAACDIASILVAKGLLHRDAPGVYSYTKK